MECSIHLCLILHILLQHFHVDGTLRSSKFISVHLPVSWNTYSLFFIYLPLFPPTISIHNWQRKGNVMFSLAVFLPQSRCQPISTIDEPWCACTLLHISSRTVRDDGQLQTEHPTWIYSTNIHHLASCVRGGLFSSRSRIIIKINLLTFVWD